MCTIAVSKSGCPQPSMDDLYYMFINNPDGAGYMYSRRNEVIINKGFMKPEYFLNAVKNERFTEADSVVYHCRIATQGGTRPEMTHPFPLSPMLSHMEILYLECGCGIAHNGIIPCTSDGDSRYSDTAKFITEYLTQWIHSREDLDDAHVRSQIEQCIGFSKLALLDGTGHITTFGEWQEENGVLYSNPNHTAEALYCRTWFSTMRKRR